VSPSRIELRARAMSHARKVERARREEAGGGGGCLLSYPSGENARRTF
jgi:hypothetical protein